MSDPAQKIDPKERPIIFSGEMVRAILEGKKTQTRRVVKLDEGRFVTRRDRSSITCCPMRDDVGPVWKPHGGAEEQPLPKEMVQAASPYGLPGDRLWVRETWRFYDWTEEGQPYIRHKADEAITLCNPPDSETDKLEDIWARLSMPENYEKHGRAQDPRWHPPIHMPRWASRILLEITDVRVERLQAITKDDSLEEVQKEGVTESEHCPKSRDGNGHSEAWWDGDGCAWCGDPSSLQKFKDLWNRIYGADAWERNDWVWVIEFRRVDA